MRIAAKGDDGIKAATVRRFYRHRTLNYTHIIIQTRITDPPSSVAAHSPNIPPSFPHVYCAHPLSPPDSPRRRRHRQTNTAGAPQIYCIIIIYMCIVVAGYGGVSVHIYIYLIYSLETLLVRQRNPLVLYNIIISCTYEYYTIRAAPGN